MPADAPSDVIAESVYELRLIPGIRYQPHPAFALDARWPALLFWERTSPTGGNDRDFPRPVRAS